jgi:hypothetical protein
MPHEVHKSASKNKLQQSSSNSSNMLYLNHGDLLARALGPILIYEARCVHNETPRRVNVKARVRNVKLSGRMLRDHAAKGLPRGVRGTSDVRRQGSLSQAYLI